MGDAKDTAKPKMVPKNKDLSGITERFQAGNNYRLTLDKSFKREAGKGSK